MSNNEIKFFLDTLYEDRELFLAVNGIARANDAKYMLVSDILEDNKSLFADVILEAIHNKQNSATTINY